MIKLFYGEDSFQRDQAVSSEIEKALKSEPEVTRVNGPVDFAIINNLLAGSFFSLKRLFVFRDVLSSIGEKESEALLQALPKVDSETSLIFTEEKLPPKSKLIDYLKKNSELKEFKAPKEVDLREFIKTKVHEEGADIAPLAIERLIMSNPENLWQLSEEITKLVLFKRGSEEPIMASDVDLLVSFGLNNNIFSLLDAIASKNTKRATTLINQFLESGENGIYILTMIHWNFRNIAMAKFDDGISEFALAKKAKINPYVAKKAVSLARGFKKEEIIDVYKKMRWADLKLKSGSDPRAVLLRLVV